MPEFRVTEHSTRPGKMVEVWAHGEFIASIYPGDQPGEIRIVTKHTISVDQPVTADLGLTHVTIQISKGKR